MINNQRIIERVLDRRHHLPEFSILMALGVVAILVASLLSSCALEVPKASVTHADSLMYLMEATGATGPTGQGE